MLHDGKEMRLSGRKKLKISHDVDKIGEEGVVFLTVGLGFPRFKIPKDVKVITITSKHIIFHEGEEREELIARFDSDDHLCVEFEDFMKDSSEVFSAISKFIGYKINSTQALKAVEKDWEPVMEHERTRRILYPSS